MVLYWPADHQTMKKHFTLVIFGSILLLPTQAQLVNGGFEDWANGDPVGWNTVNFPPSAVPITQSTDAQLGNYAAHGVVLENPFTPGQPLHPFMSTDQIPISQPPTSLTGWYKYSPTLNSTFLLISILVADENDEMTGIGGLQVFNAATGYTSFTIPVDYTQGTGLPAASVLVSVMIAEEDPLNGGFGSTFHVDGFAISNSTGIGELDPMLNLTVGHPFPQPLTDECSIRLGVMEAGPMTIDVIDISGRQCGVLMEGSMMPGEHLVSWLPPATIANGTYFIRIITSDGSIMRKISVQR